jgi:hypothetical protein
MVFRTLLGLKRKDTWALLICCLLGYPITRSLPGQQWAVYASILLAFHLFLAWLVFTREKRDGPSPSIPAAAAIHLVFVAVVVILVAALQYFFPQLKLVRLIVAAIAALERWFLFQPPSRGQQRDDAIDLLAARQGGNLAPAQPGANFAPLQPSALPAPADAIGAAPKAASAVGAPATAPTSEIPQYQSLTGVALPQSPAAAAQPQPAAAAPEIRRAVRIPGSKQVLVEDTSIAAGLRRKPVQQEEKSSPILDATAEDHEAWLRERASGNPTHRRPGVSVKQEYEEWLKARFKARAAQSARKGKAAAL